MKAWDKRSRKDKAARIVLSLAIIGYVGVTAPLAVTEVYDYVTADACRSQLSTAIQAGLDENQTLATGNAGAQALAVSARGFAENVAAVRCPTSIAGAQNDLVTALQNYAAVQQRNVDGSVGSDVRANASRLVGAALDKLYAVLGQ